MSRHSAALPIASLALRVLIAGNWLVTAAIVVLLIATPHQQWIMKAFKLSPGPDADRLIAGMQIIAVLGIVVFVLHYVILKRLLDIVRTVREGDPFVAANAARLQTIAWTLLALQVFGIVIAGVGKAVTTPAHPVDLDAGFSVNGWLAVVLTFVLARVFAHGTAMRDDLEGTI